MKKEYTYEMLKGKDTLSTNQSFNIKVNDNLIVCDIDKATIFTLEEKVELFLFKSDGREIGQIEMFPNDKITIYSNDKYL